MRLISASLAMLALFFGTYGVFAAGEQAQRYVMSPAEGGGMVRLDTLTGAIALCRSRDGQWSCEEMADKTATLRAENEKLRQDNEALQAENRRLEELILPGTTPGTQPQAKGPHGRLELPSEEDVDKAMTYLGRMFRKFRDKLKEFEDDGRGTPL